MSSLDYVNIEDGTVNIVVFDQTRAALAELKKRYTDVPDCSTEEGYALAKTGKNVLTKYRTKLEATRKEIKKPYQDSAALIDLDAKGIRLALEAIENPIKDALKIADEAEAKKKDDFDLMIRDRINDDIYGIEEKALNSEGKEAVAEFIQHLTDMDVDKGFYHLTSEAQDAKAIVLDRLGYLYGQRLNSEVAESQRLDAEERSRVAEEEAKQLRDLQAENSRVAVLKERIMQLREKPMDLMEADSDTIALEINELTWLDMTQEHWKPVQEEAIKAYNAVVERLGKMFRIAKAEEDRVADDQPEPVVEVEQAHANTYNAPLYNIETHIEPSGVIHEPIEEPTKLMVWADSWDIDGECFRQLLEIIECEK